MVSADKTGIGKAILFGSDQQTDWHIGSPIVWTDIYEGISYTDCGVVQEYIPNEKLSYNYLSS